MDWYYVDASGNQASAPESQLAQMFSSGQVGRDTLIWNEGMSDWKPAGEVKPEWFGGGGAATPVAAAAVASSAAGYSGASQSPAAGGPTNGLAIASLICSIAGLGCVGVSSVAGIVCGHIALSQIKKNPNQGGRGLAIAGVIVGYLLVGFWFLYFLAFLIFGIAGGLSGGF
ncbi:MAG: DUF4190 domain-containing protein [Verrucomicrobiota bacterium]